ADGVGVERGEAHAGCHRGGRTAGRSTGDVVGVQRILDGTKVAHERRRALAELVHVRLADDDGAGALQLGDGDRVLGWNSFGEVLERGSRPDAGGVEEVSL